MFCEADWRARQSERSRISKVARCQSSYKWSRWRRRTWFLIFEDFERREYSTVSLLRKSIVLSPRDWSAALGSASRQELRAVFHRRRCLENICNRRYRPSKSWFANCTTPKCTWQPFDSTALAILKSRAFTLWKFISAFETCLSAKRDSSYQIKSAKNGALIRCTLYGSYIRDMTRLLFIKKGW